MIRDDIGKAVKITNYFNLPETKVQLILLGIITLIFALVQSVFNGENLSIAVGKGFLLLFAPTVLSAALFRVVKNISIKRSHFLMMIAAVIYTIVYSAYFIMDDVNILILGYSISFILIVIISFIAFKMKYSGILLSLIQVFLFAYSMYYLEDITSSPKDIMFKLAVASFTLSLFAYIIAYVFNAPLKKAFSVKSTSAISKFVSQWLYESKELEEEFERIGQEVNINVDSILLRNKRGTCIITVPQVHFGPFGTLGGSNFPHLISKELEKTTDCAIVLHGACTHDMNPTSSKEVYKITNEISKFLRSHRSQKPTKTLFLETKAGNSKAHHLILGDTLFSTFTRYPETTEDMDYGLGLVLKEKGHRLFDKTIIADEHNSETGEITQFVLGTKEAEEYMEAMDQLIKKPLILKGHRGKAAFGKWLDDSHMLYGIGDNGVGIVIFQMGRKKILYLVFDANGIKPSSKEKLEEILKGEGYDQVIILTTDSHTLNKVSGIVNPIGDLDDEFIDELIKHINKTAKDISEFTFDSIEQKVKVKVFGPTQSLKLINTFNAMVAIAKFMLPTLIIAGITATLWALSKV